MSTNTLPYRHPQTLEELQTIIDHGLMESIHLEFKRSDAVIKDKPRTEISKDVSSFANSDGGVIIYGVEEVDHVPERIDGGVDPVVWSKERLEDVIQSNIAPRLDGLRISLIPIGEGRCAYVVSVPRSERGPHQDRVTQRYFKRHNFKSAPMEDYEIADVRNRRAVVPPLISVRVDVRQGVLLEVVVENVGNSAASDIQLTVDPPLHWEHGEPQAFSKGIRSLLPSGKLCFLYGSGPTVLGGTSLHVREFTVTASYFHHGAQRELSDRFHIDLNSLVGALQERTDLQVQVERLEKVLKSLNQEVKALREGFSRLAPLADPTGLSLSVTTLRNLAHLMNVPITIEKIDPETCAWQSYQEVLGVDARIATQLHACLRRMHAAKKLEEIEGLTPEILARLRLHYVVDPAL